MELIERLETISVNDGTHVTDDTLGLARGYCPTRQ
jgi:hypothetical protein